MMVCYTFSEHEKRHLVKHDCRDDRSEIDLMMKKTDHRLMRNVTVIVGDECVTPSSSEECESDCW